MDVGGVVVESRHRAHHSTHNCHGMRVAAEALIEAGHLLVHHSVARHAVLEILRLLRRWQLAVEEQVGGFEEIAVLCQLFYRIAAVEEHTLIAVDERNRRGARRRGSEPGVEGEAPGERVELGDVDDLRPRRTSQDVEIPRLVADRERCCLGGRGLVHVHLFLPSGGVPRRPSRKVLLARKLSRLIWLRFANLA